MVTEVERDRDLENWKAYFTAGGAGGGRGGRGSSDGQGGGGGMERDQRLLLQILDNLVSDLDTFGLALTNEGFYQYVENDDERAEMMTMGELANTLIDDTTLKLKALRGDLSANYPLRHTFLFGAGLTGDPLLFKSQVAQKSRLPTESNWTHWYEVVAFLRRSRENFGLAGKILGSLEEALKEFPGIKTLLEAIDELLAIFKFWTRHIDRAHNSYRYISPDDWAFVDE